MRCLNSILPVIFQCEYCRETVSPGECLIEEHYLSLFLKTNGRSDIIKNYVKFSKNQMVIELRQQSEFIVERPIKAEMN